MNLKPLGDRLVVQPAEPEEQTSTGLFLPETAKEKPQQGKVIATGPGARTEGDFERGRRAGDGSVSSVQ